MEREEEKKKGSSGNKARGDIGDPRIHRGAQTAWSLYHGVLIYDRAHECISSLPSVNSSPASSEKLNRKAALHKGAK